MAQSPQYKVYYFASVREAANDTTSESFDYPPTCQSGPDGSGLRISVQEVLARCVAKHPGLQAVVDRCMVALNQEYVPQGTGCDQVWVKPNDEVALIPPVSGG
ncbi:hypothetical protein H4R33_006135 [Dimargaris cristalligena]|nr:hypothetical protein H4R33_006135 [Dimargaris cristalligena]